MTDRELDALVAEKVMGWTDVAMRNVARGGGMHGTVVYESVAGIPTGYRTVLDQTGRSQKFDPLRPAPPFSTDISAAWSVVEQMRELGWHIDLDNDGSQKIGAEESWTWNALLWTDRDDYDGDGDGDWPTAHADTAPRAICLAALRAVGVEVES